MRRLTRNAIAVGLTAILATSAVVGLSGCGENEYQGKTGAEWAGLAEGFVENHEYNKAIAHFKAAEEADEGDQYQVRLKEVRRERKTWLAEQVPETPASVVESRAHFKGLPKDGNFALYTVGKGDIPSVVAAKLEAAIDGTVYRPSRVEEKGLYTSPEWTGIMGAIRGRQMRAEGWTEADGIDYDTWNEGDEMPVPYKFISQLK